MSASKLTDAEYEARKPDVDEAWIEAQMKHFEGDDLDGAVRLLRAHERARRERAATQKGAAA